MKTKLLLPFIFLFSFFESGAQEYHPYLANSYWVVSDWVSCCRPPYIRVIEPGTETAIGEYTYMKFVDPFPYSAIDTIYVREDVLEKKVYKIVDGVDELMYDFSLETGDVVTHDGIDFTATVDEIAVNAGNRKRITLSSVETFSGHTLTQIWIEGVGTIAHPFYPARNMWNVMSTGGGLVFTTRCGFQGPDHIYGNSDMCIPYLDNPTFTAENREIVLSPNPFSSQMSVSSDSDFDNATLRLYSAQGKLVREINGINGRSATMQRETLSSGLYFAQLLEDGQVLRTIKVVAD